jgi:hypothetical protein
MFVSTCNDLYRGLLGVCSRRGSQRCLTMCNNMTSVIFLEWRRHTGAASTVFCSCLCTPLQTGISPLLSLKWSRQTLPCAGALAQVLSTGQLHTCALKLLLKLWLLGCCFSCCGLAVCPSHAYETIMPAITQSRRLSHSADTSCQLKVSNLPIDVAHISCRRSSCSQLMLISKP